MTRILFATAALLTASFLTLSTAHSGPTGALEGVVQDARRKAPIRGAIVRVLGQNIEQRTGKAGKFLIKAVAPGTYRVQCAANGYRTHTLNKVTVRAGKKTTVVCTMRVIPRPTPDVAHRSPSIASEPAPMPAAEMSSVPMMMPQAGSGGGRAARAPGRRSRSRSARKRPSVRSSGALRLSRRDASGATSSRTVMARRRHRPMPPPPPMVPNTENYAKIDDAPFRPALTEPLSTFSIDVDTAAYANARRFIEQQGRLPVADAVRIEEFINYFDYAYPEPEGDLPFAVHTEISTAPWNPTHRLVHIGLQGKKVAMENLPPSNLVFLIDVSGSMRQAQKLPLLKKSFQLMAHHLRPQDHVAIVVYAGAAGLVLPPTSGAEKDKIFAALEGLRAGGSTAGGAGIQLAYKTAREHFIEGGNNRIILATDGDFNVGTSNTAELERMVAHERESGVFLTILGFGRGNYKDARMETLSNKGNGNAAYIDSLLEAKKVLVTEMGGTLLTIAKDVKIQVEFNPTKVKGYRLIGYENRALRNQDFNDDKKDAGELGAGHTVTVLYEIIPADSAEPLPGVDPLKYQRRTLSEGAESDGELMTVKLRYKQPTGTKSALIEHPVMDAGVALTETSNAFRFSAAVASFGMLLRDSKLKGATSYPQVIEWARHAAGDDAQGYRAGFVQLVRKAEVIAQLSGKTGPRLAR